MAQKGLPMRKVREFLRLRFGLGLSGREVARSLGISSSTASEYGQRAREAGLGWPLPEDMDDVALERALFRDAAQPPRTDRGLPEIGFLKREMAKPGVTLMLLWTEYKQANPAGYQYTQFCEHYRRGVGRLDLVMRQEHRPGDKMFVDWAGDPAWWVDRETGERREAKLFVAVLGASSYTYAEAAADESGPNWIGAHVRALEFFGGCTAAMVCDNTLTAVTKPHRYEPGLHPLYEDMAAHYGAAVLPAGVRRPREKAKVESGVLVAERWILAALRNRTFFSLQELNAAIRELLERLNSRPFRHMEGSRRTHYEQFDRPALVPLPGERYRWTEWKTATVNIDYHIECEHHFYSVPYTLVRERVDIRLSPTMMEVMHGGRRVASHLRSYVRGHHTTSEEHMPLAHRRYRQAPSQIASSARDVGPKTVALVEAILAARPHPEQGYRSCLGLLSLRKRYTPERLEAACGRALELGAFSYTAVKSMLSSGLDKAPRAEPIPLPLEHAVHENVRGPAYYREVK
ncbi:MAG: IS21 family transposase [Clostridia bacterium]